MDRLSARFRRARGGEKKLPLTIGGKMWYTINRKCRSGGKTGLAVEPVLLLEQDGGGYSEALEKIYRDYRANAGWKNRS